MVDDVKLLPCPFCGSTNIDPEGWASTERKGPACDDCSGSADTVEMWNRRARLSQAGAGGGVVVKPLEWSKDNSVGGHGGWIGRAGNETRAVKIGWVVEEPFEFGTQTFKTLDEAKAAAQADYEARILAALAPSPSAGEPVAWPWGYQQTFDAIGAAVSIYGGGAGINISVEKFRAALPTPPATPVQLTASVDAVAWRYELAGAVRHNADGTKTGENWKWHLTEYKPNVPDWSIRNLVALGALASLTPAPTQGEAGDV